MEGILKVRKSPDLVWRYQSIRDVVSDFYLQHILSIGRQKLLKFVFKFFWAGSIEATVLVVRVATIWKRWPL